jgi:soluble lytic murein transglycosylase-like protein
MRSRVSGGLERLRSGTSRSLHRWALWAWQGVVDIGHNSLAVLGLACIGVVVFFSSDSALRMQIERQALEWLNLRHGIIGSSADEPRNLLAELAEPDAVGRATARDPSALPREQAQVVSWLSRRYRVAPEPVASLVQEAWTIGRKGKLDPTLILAIVAIESSFNPFAQSPVGAQGLMQVMTRVHDDKYSAFGGKLAAFDPLANLRVGAQILSEYLARADGNVELALKYYVGAANLPDDGGYAERVLAERGFLRAVADGQAVAWNAPNTRSTPQAQASGSPAAPASAGPAVSPGGGAGATALADRRAPAGPAEPGTLMAPAVGAALATNLSAPAPAVTGAAAPHPVAPPARAVAAEKTMPPRAPATVASAPYPGIPAAPALVPVVAPAATPTTPSTAPGPTAATDTAAPRPRADGSAGRVALAPEALR